MGWDFILKGVALCLGLRVMKFLFETLQPPEAITMPIEALYAIGMWAFIGVSAVSAFKILTGGRRAVR
jgi:hypothetical protein